MRILQIMAGAEHGGAEAFFNRLAIGFHRAGVEQKVIIRDWPSRMAQLREAGLEPIGLPFGGMFDFKTGRAIRKQIAQFKPDIVMTWMNRATRFCPKGPFVHVARLGGYYDLKYYRNCDHLIGNTQDIVDYLIKSGWAEDKAHYLPNFVSHERAEPFPRKKLFTPEGSSLILGLGRLHENKAFDVLLKAVARVPNSYLWLAGEGPLRAELETLAGQLAVKPRVRFLGWRDDVAALFAAADLFVCPSRHEPLGNVVIEAWAQGVPVVAADSLGPGTLIEQGQTGLLSAVDDVDGMAQAIKYMLAEPEEARRMAENGYALYQERFTEKAVVEHYLKFFEKVLG